jgi:hypothetical protein
VKRKFFKIIKEKNRRKIVFIDWQLRKKKKCNSDRNTDEIGYLYIFGNSSKKARRRRLNSPDINDWMPNETYSFSWINKSTAWIFNSIIFLNRSIVVAIDTNIKPELPHGLCNRPYVNLIFRFVESTTEKRHFRDFIHKTQSGYQRFHLISIPCSLTATLSVSIISSSLRPTYTYIHTCCIFPISSELQLKQQKKSQL